MAEADTTSTQRLPVTLFGVTAARSDDSFAYAGPAPMRVPLDVDPPNGALPPVLADGASSVLATATPSTTISGVPVTATGNVLQWEWSYYVSVGMGFYGRLRVRIPWEVTLGGAAGSRGRVRATIQRRRSGILTALTGVTAAVGAIRPLDALGRHDENALIVDLPATVGKFVDRDELVVVAHLEVTTTGAGGGATVRFHHDPFVAANRVAIETS